MKTKVVLQLYWALLAAPLDLAVGHSLASAFGRRARRSGELEGSELRSDVFNAGSRGSRGWRRGTRGETDGARNLAGVDVDLLGLVVVLLVNSPCHCLGIRTHEKKEHML